MKFHGVNAVGKIHVQRVDTLPTFQPGEPPTGDRGRILFVESVSAADGTDDQTGGMFIGAEAGWSSGIVLTETGTLLGNIRYFLFAEDGNLMLKEVVMPV